MLATEQRFFVPEIRRWHGVILDALGRRDEAEKRLREAIAVARKQGSRSWELRATTSLARLHQTADARDELLTICKKFTEGFDTPDLKDANALLDELA